MRPPQPSVKFSGGRWHFFAALLGVIRLETGHKNMSHVLPTHPSVCLCVCGSCKLCGNCPSESVGVKSELVLVHV